MAYEMRDLGYKRTPTSAIFRVEMGDGSKWDVPVQVIADDRDKFYADEHEDTILGIREESLPSSEIADWAGNNMNWSDVHLWAAKADIPAKPVNFQEGWMNGEKQIVGAL